jgi:hypothetical protein
VQKSEVPVLRWVFVREAEQLQCELSLDHERLLYELRTRRLGTHVTETVEHYRDVGRAFHRQSDVERGLVQDGWSLTRYEKRTG